MLFQLNRASEHEKKLEELAEEERRKRRLAAEVQQEDREWEEAQRFSKVRRSVAAR